MSRSGLVAASVVLFAGARLAHGQPAGSEFQANTNTTNDQRRAAVGVFPDGGFVVTWNSNPQPSPAPPSTGQDGDRAGIFAQRFDSTGAKVGPEFQVNTYTTGNQFISSVAVDPSTSGFVVVWMGPGPGDPDYGVFARLFDSGGTPAGPEFLVNTHTTDSQGVPRVATDALGNFVVVWQSQQDGGTGYYGTYGIFGRLFDSSGNPQTGEFQVNTYATGYQSYAHVAMNPTGAFVVVWNSTDYDNPSASQDGSYAGVFGQRYDSAGDPFDPEFQVNLTTAGNQYRPRVTMQPLSGDFVVVWSGSGPGNTYGITGAQFYTPLGGMPPSLVRREFPVSTDGGSFPAAAPRDVGGNFVVVWQAGHDGDGSGVFGQRFDSSGYPVGGEFQVNAYVTGRQVFPAVGMNDNGDAAVAWNSGSARRQFTPPGPTQDGDRDGIFGQVCPASDITDPTVAVRSPIGAATLYSGMAYTITWTAADNCSLSFFDVLVSLDGGATFAMVCSNLPGTARSCPWTVPPAATTMGRVRVVAQDASTNSGQDDSNANFKIVGGTPSVTVTTPNSPGPSWQVGSTKQIKWQHNLGKGELVRIEVNRNYPNGPWNIVAEAAPSTGPSTGTFDWVVTPFFGAAPGSTTARIRITALGHATATDDGDVNFSITSRVQVTVPNTAFTWTIGTTKKIKWTHNYGANHTFNIQIDRDSTTGGGFEGIASNILGTGAGGSFKWVVTGPATTRARIRVMKTGDGRGFDISDADFEIAP